MHAPFTVLHRQLRAMGGEDSGVIVAERTPFLFHILVSEYSLRYLRQFGEAIDLFFHSLDISLRAEIHQSETHRTRTVIVSNAKDRTLRVIHYVSHDRGVIRAVPLLLCTSTFELRFETFIFTMVFSEIFQLRSETFLFIRHKKACFYRGEKSFCVLSRVARMSESDLSVTRNRRALREYQDTARCSEIQRDAAGSPPTVWRGSEEFLVPALA